MHAQARRNLILDHLRTSGPVSQRELVDALAASQVKVTQTTVSRDLASIGAVKTRDGYTIPDALLAAPSAPTSNSRAIQSHAHAAAQADALVVLKTSPGHAAIVGDALDADPPAGVVGTIAGENTVFVATVSKDRAAELAKQFTKLILGND